MPQDLENLRRRHSQRNKMLTLVLLFVLCLAMGQQDDEDTRFIGGRVGGVVVGEHGVVPGVVPGQSYNCRYWCRTPQGEYYCCENFSKPAGPVGKKPDMCPPPLSKCPPTRAYSGLQTCSNDYSCAVFEKCCYDTCLRKHVCKPLQYDGVPFGKL